jgi:branched-chain amino acid transport system substrate-binding protein
MGRILIRRNVNLIENMINKISKYFVFVIISWCCIYSTNLFGQELSQTAGTDSDTLIYGKTPSEYEPYHRFEKPYMRFFLDQLEYPGYGRHTPEPSGVDTVYIGFIGPIINTETDTIGDLKNIKLKVNQRVIRWDGYQASHLAPMGIKMLQGALLAVEQANQKGGYRGKIPYKLIVRNDNGNWRSSGRELIMLAYKDSVWAVLGTVDGANSHIMIRAALKAEIAVMNSADTDPTYVETNIPWVFRCITDDRQMCYLLADFAFKTLGLKRVAALRATNRYGRMSIDEFRDAATRMGHPFIIELQYQEGDTDFSKQLKRIQSLHADGIITYGNAIESALILKQMRELGMKQWYLGSDRMITQEFLEITGRNVKNVAAAYPYDPRSTDPDYIQFKKDFAARFNEKPETYAAHAYDGMNMILSATEKAGLNRALIRDALVGLSEYKGVTGKKEFDAVFTNRSPATIAILNAGEFKFYSGNELLPDLFQSND